MDFPGDIVDKIGIYLKQNQEEIETGKIFISSIYNEVKDSSRNLTQQIIKRNKDSIKASAFVNVVLVFYTRLRFCPARFLICAAESLETLAIHCLSIPRICRERSCCSIFLISASGLS